MTARPSGHEITSRRENRPKGYAAWRPQTKTRILLGKVNEVLDEYANHLPLTVRQIFYRLVGQHGYEKTEKAYNRLAEHLVRARRARMIPFDVIRDDGVVGYSTAWYASPEDFWAETARRIRRYRRDRQAGQPQYVELWCEAAGMAPQLARVADEFSVPVYSTGGFGSLSAVKLIAERTLDRNVRTLLLHVGDHDPSGESIFAAIAADAAAFVEADRAIQTLRLDAKRIALTAEQVATYALPTAPAKPSDSRSRNWHGGTCQLEALAPDQLAELVRDAIANELDDDAYKRQIEQEDHDIAELKRGLPPGTDEETP